VSILHLSPLVVPEPRIVDTRAYAAGMPDALAPRRPR
jgi:hypothetical protein